MKLQTATALLDANVLYPAPVRDLLLYMASEDLYLPKWTELIHEEWIKNLLLNRPELTPKSLNAAKQAMNLAFPNATVKNFYSLTEKLRLPDADDRHVLAAAIRAKANLIVTFNVKDFPQKHLAQFSVHAIHPDDFILKLARHNKQAVLKALRNQAANLKNPPMTEKEVLHSLKKCGLKKSLLCFEE